MRNEDLLLNDPRALLEQAEQFLKQLKTDVNLNGFLSQLQKRDLETI